MSIEFNISLMVLGLVIWIDLPNIYSVPGRAVSINFNITLMVLGLVIQIDLPNSHSVPGQIVCHKFNISLMLLGLVVRIDFPNMYSMPGQTVSIELYTRTHMPGRSIDDGFYLYIDRSSGAVIDGSNATSDQSYTTD
jgi:hypothetical protein